MTSPIPKTLGLLELSRDRGSRKARANSRPVAFGARHPDDVKAIERPFPPSHSPSRTVGAVFEPIEAVIPSTARRKPLIAHDHEADRQRNSSRECSPGSKDFRRIGRRCDKRASPDP